MSRKTIIGEFMHNLIKVKVEGKNINNYILWLIKTKLILLTYH